MKLATIQIAGKEEAAIVFAERFILIQTINELEKKKWGTDLFQLLQTNQLVELIDWYKNEGESKLSHLPSISVEEAVFAPLYRHPQSIWGVGMNYFDKAIELTGKPPEEDPIIFMKPVTSLIGHGEAITLPRQSRQVTSEAELAIIIGESCKDIAEAEAHSVIAGYTTAIDVTAKDIHAKNSRFLQRSKSFDTFFSFGPYFITADEYTDLKQIIVKTVLNGEEAHHNTVANMMYKPSFIVSYFSQIMTLNPGDVIMTGTPGSVIIRDGDFIECQIDGFKALRNPVIDFK